MARTIDERVVQMTFQNDNFERNANETISTLDKLKSSLKFDGAANGLQDIEKAANKVSFNGLGEAVEDVKNKFSDFEIFVVGMFARVGARVGDLLVNTVKGFTIDPLMQSWGKFEQAVVSEQTIMSAVSDKINDATGQLYQMSDVNAIVDQLRWYTDETSYNIDQMTNAIGSFTASGVDLKIAKTAIMGISNACADAGVSVEKAGSAFDGFSKAIGSGILTLGQWNNQLKTSGLTNSERFRNSLLEAAASMGELTKQIDKDGKIIYKRGNEIVNSANITDFMDKKSSFFTTEIMLKALESYSDTVDALYDMVSSGKIDLTTKGMEKFREAMEKQGKTMSSLGLKKEYDTTSEAISDLTEAYKKLGLEVPKSLTSFSRAQEAVSFSQAVSSIKEAVTSKWSKTFELIFGDYEEGKELWTKLANEGWEWFAAGGEARNELLQKWHDGISDFIISDGLEEDTKRSTQIIEKFNKDIEQAYKNSYLNIESNNKLYRINFLKALRFGDTKDIGKYITENSENFKNIKFFSESELGTISELYEEYQSVVESTDEELDKEKEILRIQKEITKEVLKSKNYTEMFNDSSIYQLLAKENTANNYESYITGLSNVLSSGDSEKIYEYINKNYKKLKEYNLLSRDIEDSYNKITEASKKQYQSSFEKKKVISELKDDLKEITLAVSNYDDINSLNKDLEILESFYSAIENEDLKEAQKIIQENFDLIGESIGGYPDSIKKLHNELNALANSGPISKIKYDLEKTRDTTFSEKDKKEAEKYLNIVNQIEDAIKAGSDEDLAKVFKNKDATEYVKKIADAGGKIDEVKKIYEEIDKINKNSTYSTISKNKLLEVQYSQLQDIFYELSKADDIAETSSKLTEALNSYLFEGHSGFKALRDILFSILDIITAIVDGVKETFNEVFEPITALDLINKTDQIKEFVESFKEGNDKLDKFKETLKGILTALKNVIGVGKTIFNNLIKPVIQSLGPLIDALFDLGEAFGKWLGIITEGIGTSDKFKGTLNKIATAITIVVNHITDLVKWLTTLFSTTDSEKPNLFKKFFEIIGDVFNTLSKVANYITDILGKAFSKIKEYITKIINVLKSPIGGSGFSPLAIGAILFGAQKLFDFKWNIVDVLSGIISTIKNVVESVSETLQEVSGIIDAQAMKLFAESFKEIAKTLLLFAVSLLIIASIDKEALGRALGVIGVFTAIILAFFKLSQTLSASLSAVNTSNSEQTQNGIIGKLLTAIGIKPNVAKKVLTVSGALIGFGVAILELSVALKLLSTINFGDMIVALVAMIISLAATVKAIDYLGKSMSGLDPIVVKSIGTLFKSMALGMILLSISLKLISSINPEKIGQALLSFLIIIASVTIAINSIMKNSFAVDASTMKSIGKVFEAIGIGMLILSASLKLISTINPGTFIPALLSFIIILGTTAIVLGDLIEVANKSSDLQGIKVIGKAFLAVSLGILVMSSALKLISTINPLEIILPLVSIISMLYVTGKVMEGIIDSSRAVSSGQILSLSVLMGALAISILELSIALKLLSTIKFTSMIKSMVAVLALFFALAAAAKYLIVSSKLISAGELLALDTLIITITGSILAMSLALKLLSTIKFTSLIKSLIGFAGILAGLVITVDLLAEATKQMSSDKLLSTTVFVIGLSSAIMILSLALKLLSTISFTQMIVSLAALAVAFLAISTFIKKIGTLDVKQLVALGIFAVAVALLMPALLKLEAVLTALSAIPTGNLIKAGIALTAVITIIVALSKVLGNNAGSIAAILAMAVSLRIMAPALIQISDAIGSLGKLPIADILKGTIALSGFIAVLSLLGLMLGNSVLGAVGILAISAALVVMMPALQAFAQVIATIGALPIEAILKGVGAISAFLAVLTILGVVLGNSVLGAVGIIALAAALVIMAASCVIFAKAMGNMVQVLQVLADMGDKVGTACKALLKILRTMALFGVVMGLLSAPLIAASLAIMVFGAAITVLANGMLKLVELVLIFRAVGDGFAETLADIIQNIAQVLAETIPAALLGIITAILNVLEKLQNTLLTFLGKVIVNVVQFLTENGEPIITMVAEFVTKVAEAIAERADRFANAAFIIIEKILSTIRDHIPDVLTLVAQVIAAALLGVSELIPSIIDSILKMLINIINGLADAIDSNAEGLGEAIGRLIGSLLTAIVRAIKGTAGGIWGEIKSLFSGEEYEYPFEEAGKKGGEVLTNSVDDGIKVGKPEIKDAVNETFEEVAEEATGPSEAGEVASGSFIDSFIGNLNSDEIMEKIGLGGTGAIDGLSTSMLGDESTMKMFDTGEGVTNNFLTGFLSEDSINKFKSSGETSITKVTDGMESENSKKEITNSANFTIDGLIDGIKSITSGNKLADAGAWIFNKLNESYRAAAEQASPSKVMAKNGKFAILGIVKGVKDNIKRVKTSGELMAEALSNAVMMAEDDMASDLNPVISPVLDLNNVERDSRYLSSMFGDASIGAYGEAGFSRILQNGVLSGGAYGNNINLNVEFAINNEGKDITDKDIDNWSNLLLDKIDNALGNAL